MFYTKYKNKWLPMAIPSTDDIHITDKSNPAAYNSNLTVDSTDSNYWSILYPVRADIDPCGLQTPYYTYAQPGLDFSGSGRDTSQDKITPLYVYPQESDYKLANFTSSTTNSKKIISKETSQSFYTAFSNYTNSTVVASPAAETNPTLNLGLIPGAGGRTTSWQDQTIYGSLYKGSAYSTVEAGASDLCGVMGIYESPNSTYAPNGSLMSGVSNPLSVQITNWPSDAYVPHAVLIKSVTFSYQPVAYIYTNSSPHGYKNMPLKFTDGNWYKTVTASSTSLGTAGTSFSFSVSRINTSLNDYITSSTSVTGTLNVSLPVGSDSVTFNLTKGGGWQLYDGGIAVNIYLRIFNIQVSYQYSAEVTYTTSQTNVTVNKQAITAFQLYPYIHQITPWTVWRSDYTKLAVNYGSGYSLWKRTTEQAIVTQAKVSSNASAIPGVKMWIPTVYSGGTAGESGTTIAPSPSSPYYSTVPSDSLIFISSYTPHSLGYVTYGVTDRTSYASYINSNSSNYAKMGYYQRLTDYDSMDEEDFMQEYIEPDFYVGSTSETLNFYPYINDSTKVWENNSSYLIGSMKLPTVYYPYRYDLVQNRNDNSIWARGTIQVKYTIANGDSTVRANLTTVKPSSTATLISGWAPSNTKTVTPKVDYYQQKLSLSGFYSTAGTSGYTESYSTTATLTAQLYNNSTDGYMYPYSQAYGTTFSQTVNVSYTKHIPAYYIAAFYDNENCSSLSIKFTTNSGNYLNGSYKSMNKSSSYSNCYVISNSIFKVVKGSSISSVTASATASSSSANGYYYRNKAYYRYIISYNINNGTDKPLTTSGYSWDPYSLDTFDFTSAVKGISGVNSSMSKTQALNLGVKMEFTEIAAPTIMSRTDAGNWKRYLTVKNPNPITFGVYYTSNKNKSYSSISSSSTWTGCGNLGPEATSSTLTINDQGGYEDKWITVGTQCGSYGLSGSAKWYHCRTITEDPTTSTSTVATFWVSR